MCALVFKYSFIIGKTCLLSSTAVTSWLIFYFPRTSKDKSFQATFELHPSEVRHDPENPIKRRMSQQLCTQPSPLSDFPKCLECNCCPSSPPIRSVTLEVFLQMLLFTPSCLFPLSLSLFKLMRVTDLTLNQS